MSMSSVDGARELDASLLNPVAADEVRPAQALSRQGKFVIGLSAALSFTISAATAVITQYYMSNRDITSPISLSVDAGVAISGLALYLGIAVSFYVRQSKHNHVQFQDLEAVMAPELRASPSRKVTFNPDNTVIQSVFVPRGSLDGECDTSSQPGTP